jgi:hypothetical protein
MTLNNIYENIFHYTISVWSTMWQIEEKKLQAFPDDVNDFSIYFLTLLPI